MADQNRLAADRRAAFDRMRHAEFEIQTRYIREGIIPDEWWTQLLQIVAEYRTAVRRCREAQ